MMKLPKIEKKHLIAGGGLTAVAVLAFLLGAARPAHEPKTDGGAERKPASAPVQEATPEDEDHYEEEEVEVQIAHHASHPVADASHDKRGAFTRLVDRYVDAWTSVNEKVQAIKTAEEENKRLKLENAYLRVTAETQKFSCRTDDAKKKTETVGHKLATTAGSRAARSIASIRYQFPENLLPEQLHALGVSYFKVKDDEKAAVILNFLTGLEDDKNYRTAANYLMAGIAFYRLDHYKNAEEYFEKIASLTESDAETMKAKRQALYWKALVAERTKDRRKAQSLILESLEKNPHTKEALWVNPKGLGSKHSPKQRVPASEESHEGHAKPKNQH